MKKFVFGVLLCCAVMTFAVSCATGSFSGVMEVTLDESSEGVLGHFDIVVKLKSHPDLIIGAYDPEIIAAVQREIVKLGGTRAIDVMVAGRESLFGNITARVTGTVVK